MFIRSKTLGHSKRLFHLSLGAFLVFLGAFVVCSNVDFSESAEATDVSSKFTVSLNDVLTISSPSSIILDNCNPSTASLCTASATVNVSTNNLTGYSLYLNATSGSSNSLTNTAVTPNPTIPTLSQSYSSANFPVNSWGYTGGTDQSGNSGYNCSTNYCPILDYEADPEDYSPNHLIKETSAPAATSNTNLTFAAKANTSKASGTYTTSITFTAVSNEVPVAITNGMDMQDIDSEACANTPTDTTYTVIDNRDNKEYTVAKLQDGNCWMTQNLALGSDTAITLTPANTNISYNFTLPASSDIGDWNGDGETPEFYDYAGSPLSQQATTKYGNYYNYPAATAGSDGDEDGVDADYDICPKGWRLPSASTSFSNNEFYEMLSYYVTTGTWDDSYVPHWEGVTTTNYTGAPVSLVFSGGWYDGLYGDESDSSLWSSTISSSGDAYELNINSDGDIYLEGDSSKFYGHSVRCLVKEPAEPITNGMYMQDVTQKNIKDTPRDTTYTLKDARDEKEYTVAKLRDDKLWMTQNLALGGSSAITLTPTNTNVASNFTLPASVTYGDWDGSYSDPEFYDYAGNNPSQQATNKYGNLYNWIAATAGTNPSSDESDYDICPKNWRMPRTLPNIYESEFYNMFNRYITTGTGDGTSWSGITTSQLTNAPVSLVFSGYFYSTSEQGSAGYLWSSTADDSTNAYYSYVTSSGDVEAYYMTDKSEFYSIRCLMPRSSN